jgi:hypothetical protein
MDNDKKVAQIRNLKLVDATVDADGEKIGIIEALSTGIKHCKEKNLKRGIVILVDEDFTPDTYLTSGVSDLGAMSICEIAKLIFMDRHMGQGEACECEEE